jgi:hypothetical protein
MAAAVVQARGANAPNTLISNVTNGNWIVVFAYTPVQGETITITTDRTTGNMPSISSLQSSGDATFGSVQVFAQRAESTGSLTVSGISNPSEASPDTVVYEISGAPTSSAFDPAVQAGSSGTGSANPNSGTLTPSAVGLSIGYVCNDTGNITVTIGAGTERATTLFNNHARHDCADLASNSSAVAASATATSRDWIAVALHVLDAGAGGRTTKNTRAWALGQELGMNLWGQH